MNIKQYGLEVRIDNIALKLFQVQGIKIVIFLWPASRSQKPHHLPGENQIGNQPHDQKDTILASSAAGIKQEKVTSHHPGPHQEAEMYCAEHEGLVMVSTDGLQHSKEWARSHLGGATGDSETPQKLRKGAAPPDWTELTPGHGVVGGSRWGWPMGSLGPLMLIRYFHRWSLRLWKIPGTVQFTTHEKIQE